MYNDIVHKQRSSSYALKISFKRKGKSFQCLKCHARLPPLFSFHVYFSRHDCLWVSDWKHHHTLLSTSPGSKPLHGFTTDSWPPCSELQWRLAQTFNSCLHSVDIYPYSYKKSLFNCWWPSKGHQSPLCPIKWLCTEGEYAKPRTKERKTPQEWSPTLQRARALPSEQTTCIFLSGC